MIPTHRPLIVSVVLAAASAAFADIEIVADPFPERIQPSKIAVALQPVVAEGLVAPVAMDDPADGSGRLFVADQTGQVRIIKDSKLLPGALLDTADRIVKLKPGFDERGLIGFALHPDFAKKGAPGFGLMYTWTSEPVDENLPHTHIALEGDAKHDNQMVLAEWRVNAAGDAVDVATSGSRRELMRIDDPQFNHNGTSLVFDKDHLLYIPIGDGGAGNDMGPGHSPQGNGQDLAKPFAKVLRIDPLGKVGAKVASGAYSVPADNPLVGKDGLDEIYAWGTRNIWGMSYDAPTGRIIAADVGNAKVEEINVITAGNFGWPLREGSFYFIRSGDKLGQISKTPPTNPSGVTYPATIDPVAQYDHEEGTSITGGYVYRGKAIAELAGLYVFGDWKSPAKDVNAGRLFVADLATGRIDELLPAGKAPDFFVRAFGRDAAGELYVLSSKKVGPDGRTGAVHKIVKP